MKFGLWYDFRCPPHSPVSWRETCAQTLEHIRYAEELGYDDIWLSEHHFIEDGYLPSLLPAAAAVAAVTSRVTIGTNILLAPFHHPVRLAEESALVDIISGGRFLLGLAVGYRREEFAGFGVPRQKRGAMTEEIIQIVLRCWTEDEFDFQGQFYRLQGVRATPKPVQRPRPELWVGALGPAAVRRAARYADGIIAGPEQVAQFAEALAAEGRNGDRARVALGLPWLYVSDDPERAWRELYPHLSYQINGYQRWFSEAGQPIFGTEPYADLEDLQARGPYLVGTPEQVREALAQLFVQAPAERYFWWAIPPGLPPREAVRSMELFARQVMPHFRGRQGP
ncbi:Alkanal monooxygenase beta chain [bacterium HR24]|jgi:alkanesulfonate monooxygenase SsuD/methylene tetrahydromethanopterin reductase-like flavin-dependent oxidoreductase (luciferase family)|nr:Alkanal monooxygenase beta chain [bacterium HR24]